jgi:uncharacterized protein GlcG (DUF336 family)
MSSLPRPSHETANAIIAAALATAEPLGVKPITGAVLDPGGHLVALQRQSGYADLRPAMAIGKAAGARSLGVSSRQIGVRAAERSIFVASPAPISPESISPAADGVTGDTSDNDELCALAGIAHARLAVHG